MGRFVFMGKEFDSFISCDVFIVYKAFIKTELLENENKNNHSEGTSTHYKIRNVR